jgi:hypothetical protein
MDAIGFGIAVVGLYLVYAAYKGEHPWTMFTATFAAAPKAAP